jgi:hypothetical protein
MFVYSTSGVSDELNIGHAGCFSYIINKSGDGRGVSFVEFLLYTHGCIAPFHEKVTGCIVDP